jgi:transposase-like protein
MAQMRLTYSKELKREALALLASGGKSRHALEQELGLRRGLFKDWKRQARDISKKAMAIFTQGPMKLALIDAQRGSHPLSLLCRTLAVSVSGVGR